MDNGVMIMGGGSIREINGNRKSIITVNLERKCLRDPKGVSVKLDVIKCFNHYEQNKSIVHALEKKREKRK